MSEAAREYIRQAITDFWGERCDIPDDDCPTCMVWAEFDKGENAVHIQRNASQDPDGTWSDGGKEWKPDEVSFKAGWDKAKQLLKPEDLEEVVITDDMVTKGAKGIWDAGGTGVSFELAPRSVVDGLMSQARASLIAALTP